MIGLALVTLVGVLAAGLKSRFESSVNDLFRADYAVNGSNDCAVASITGHLPARGKSEAVIILWVHKDARDRIAWRGLGYFLVGRGICQLQQRGAKHSKLRAGVRKPLPGRT